MLYKTHIVSSFIGGEIILASASMLIPLNNQDIFLFIFSLFMGSIFPDIDHANSRVSRGFPILKRVINKLSEHRGFTHSIYGVLLFSIPVLLSGIYPLLGFIFGYLFHILGDMVTYSGITFFKKRIKLKFMGSFLVGSIEEKYIYVYFLSGQIFISILLLAAITK